MAQRVGVQALYAKILGSFPDTVWCLEKLANLRVLILFLHVIIGWCYIIAALCLGHELTQFRSFSRLLLMPQNWEYQLQCSKTGVLWYIDLFRLAFLMSSWLCLWPLTFSCFLLIFAILSILNLRALLGVSYRLFSNTRNSQLGLDVLSAHTAAGEVLGLESCFVAAWNILSSRTGFCFTLRGVPVLLPCMALFLSFHLSCLVCMWSFTKDFLHASSQTLAYFISAFTEQAVFLFEPLFPMRLLSLSSIPGARERVNAFKVSSELRVLGDSRESSIARA